MSRKMFVIRPGPDKVVVIGIRDPKSRELQPRVGVSRRKKRTDSEKH